MVRRPPRDVARSRSGGVTTSSLPAYYDRERLLQHRDRGRQSSLPSEHAVPAFGVGISTSPFQRSRSLRGGRAPHRDRVGVAACAPYAADGHVWPPRSRPHANTERARGCALSRRAARFGCRSPSVIAKMSSGGVVGLRRSRPDRSRGSRTSSSPCKPRVDSSAHRTAARSAIVPRLAAGTRRRREDRLCSRNPPAVQLDRVAASSGTADVLERQPGALRIERVACSTA